MNTTELVATIKSASVETAQTQVTQAEIAEVRKLNTIELAHIGGGTGHVSIV